MAELCMAFVMENVIIGIQKRIQYIVHTYIYGSLLTVTCSSPSENYLLSNYLPYMMPCLHIRNIMVCPKAQKIARFSIFVVVECQNVYRIEYIRFLSGKYIHMDVLRMAESLRSRIVHRVCSRSNNKRHKIGFGPL